MDVKKKYSIKWKIKKGGKQKEKYREIKEENMKK